VVSPAADALCVANSASDSVTRVNLATARVVAEIPVGRGPVGINASPSGDRIYVGNRAEGTVSVIGTADDREWDRIRVGEAPAGCTVDRQTGHLLVSNTGTGTLTVIEDKLDGPRGVQIHREPALRLVGRRLPEFDLVDLRSGRLRSSREWSERKYILNFFASW
jgi:YVTN family beta-propeller protein